MLLLESPERLIRRLAADLIEQDQQAARAIKRAAAKAWRAKNLDRVRWTNANGERRHRGVPELTFDEYMTRRLRREVRREEQAEKVHGKKPGIRLMDDPNRKRWHKMNYARRRAGKEEMSFEAYERYRAETQSIKAIGRTVVSEREERYRQLKERLKKELLHNEYRASRIGILTPEEMRMNTMEDRSTTEHYWDKMTRQVEGSPTHPGGSDSGGWISLGAGGFRKRARGTF